MMSLDEGEKKVKKKGWQPKRADWREGAQEVCVCCVRTRHVTPFHVRVLCVRALPAGEQAACTP